MCILQVAEEENITVYRLIFAPSTLEFYGLNSPRHSCVQREIIWDIGICPVLNLLADNKDEKGWKQNGGEYFPVYIINSECD